MDLSHLEITLFEYSGILSSKNPILSESRVQKDKTLSNTCKHDARCPLRHCFWNASHRVASRGHLSKRETCKARYVTDQPWLSFKLTSFVVQTGILKPIRAGMECEGKKGQERSRGAEYTHGRTVRGA